MIDFAGHLAFVCASWYFGGWYGLITALLIEILVRVWALGYMVAR